MRYVALIFSFVFLSFSHLGAADEKKDPPLRATCRENPVFKAGEEAEFTIVSDADGEALVRFSEDGFKVLAEKKVPLVKGEPVKVAASLDKPGFLQMRVTLGKEEAIAAAAYDPGAIRPGAKPPEDFDAFWDSNKKELAKVPFDAKLERSEKFSDDKIDCYKISLAQLDGKRVHGWIAVPKGKGPFPAVLNVPYAGVYGIEPEREHALRGALSMNIIIHDLPVDEKPEFYQKQADGPLQDYRNIGMDDRNKSYFRSAILACERAVEYLASRPDFNGKDLAVVGSSQGGGLALITAGLDSRVTVCVANVPALCDHAGPTKGQVAGWPNWQRRLKGDQAEKVRQTAEYFDAANFARRFKGKSLVGVGFLDTACPPTTVYAAFNMLPEPKDIIASPRMGHGTDPKFAQARREFLEKNLSLGTK